MKNWCFVLFCAITLSSFCEGFTPNYLEHSLYGCIRCLCHARSGCWRRQNCARYSISHNYWQQAGGLTVNKNDDPNSYDSYKRCLEDENCIVGTIIQYTQKFDKIDCNCDGSYDCKDRFAIHLFGDRCENPKFNETYARRFNECATTIGVEHMLPVEGDDTCTGPTVV